MGIVNTVKGWFAPPRPSPTASFKARPPRTSGRARVSINDATDTPFSSMLFIVPPPDDETLWRTETLDSTTLDRMSPADLIELLMNLSPEVSRALFDHIRMMNPGWELKALRPGTDEEDTIGQVALDAILKTLRDLYVTEDVVFNRLILAGFIRGAFFAELVLDDAGRVPIDLATPDPWSVRFRKVDDPQRGTIYELGQFQVAGWVSVDVPTVAYVPIDPPPDSPYGRAEVAPALFTAIFLIGILHDLRRVVAQQGYPRLDISVDTEKLNTQMPQNIENDIEKVKDWVDAIIKEVEEVYGALEPDDAYIHLDTIALNRPVGTLDTSSLGAIDGIIAALERMATRALKTIDLLMGLDVSGSETHANRQWETHAARIKAMQHLLESLLENLFTLALRAQGIQADVQFRFAELRASEELRDAQAEAMKLANIQTKEDAGYISHEEAGMEATGHPPTGEKAAPPPQFLTDEDEIIEGDGEGEEPESSEEDTENDRVRRSQRNGR